VLIGFLDAADPFHLPAARAVGEAGMRGTMLLPLVAYAEVLGGVRLAGAPRPWFDEVLDRLGIQVVDATPDIAAIAAELRASSTSGWRLPDALVVASALVAAVDHVVTTDGGWPPVEGIHVDVLVAS
jgi:predicted nucleic acid-binding protein